jgi:hypothetical protein
VRSAWKEKDAGEWIGPWSSPGQKDRRAARAVKMEERCTERQRDVALTRAGHLHTSRRFIDLAEGMRMRTAGEHERGA